MKKNNLFIFLLILSNQIYAQDIYNADVRINFSLLPVKGKNNTYALFSSRAVVEGKEYSLGDGDLLKSYLTMNSEKGFNNAILEKIDNYHVRNTKLFVKRRIFHKCYGDKHFGGQVFKKVRASKVNKESDTLVISYIVNSDYVLLDSTMSKKTMLFSLHCYVDNAPIIYPIFIPINIYEYKKISKKSMMNLNLKIFKKKSYYFIDCD